MKKIIAYVIAVLLTTIAVTAISNDIYEKSDKSIPSVLLFWSILIIVIAAVFWIIETISGGSK